MISHPDAKASQRPTTPVTIATIRAFQGKKNSAAMAPTWNAVMKAAVKLTRWVKRFVLPEDAPFRDPYNCTQRNNYSHNIGREVHVLQMRRSCNSYVMFVDR